MCGRPATRFGSGWVPSSKGDGTIAEKESFRPKKGTFLLFARSKGAGSEATSMMRACVSNPETLRQSSFRRGWRIATTAVIVSLIAIPLCLAQAPSESVAGKVEEPKPAKAAEPDPTSNCPWLDSIFDDQELPTSLENRDEYYAFDDFIRLAQKFPLDVLAKHADPRITWRIMFDRERAKYRGKIVHVEGALKLFRWIGSNKDLESTGTKDLYEAWLVDPDHPDIKTCVVVSELLPGQTLSEKAISGINASCDGYFFKRYKYQASDKPRLAPLIIGRSIVTSQVHPAIDAGAEAFGRLFLPTVCILALGMVALAF